VLVCAPPTLDGLAAGIGLLDELRDAADVRRRWLVVCGGGPYRLRDVQQTIGTVAVVGQVPFDPRATRELIGGAGLPPRSGLACGAGRLAEHLARELPAPRSSQAAETASMPSAASRSVSEPGGGVRPAVPAFLEMYDRPQPGALSSNGHGRGGAS
jgi:hypothetical protein